jgi:N6-L-threonylcarbamoyladenine synthase
MKILSIETSCDETAISIINASGGFTKPKFKILSEIVLSQAKLHAEYGGVFPNLAKREHSKNLMPILLKTLKQAGYLHKYKKDNTIPKPIYNKLQKILEREPELLNQFSKEIPKIKIPEFDAIAVTHGPGLEPALWVGINFAKALSLIWNKPLIPVNHMNGHIFSVLLNNLEKNYKIKFPVLSLLVSGGHTELILIKDLTGYKKIGQTRDDAVGEAFDKVARILGLPYPGGPEISKLAQLGSEASKLSEFKLPRPMMNSDNYDFSFSGLKTAVLYMVKNIPKLTPKIKANIAKEFQQASIDVLISKTIKAAKEYNVKTITLGGGVSANKELRIQLKKEIDKEIPGTEYKMPDIKYTGDNATMISVAGYFEFLGKGPSKSPIKIKARGNLSL